jgi:hypothetical protein
MRRELRRHARRHCAILESLEAVTVYGSNAISLFSDQFGVTLLTAQ